MLKEIGQFLLGPGLQSLILAVVFLSVIIIVGGLGTWLLNARSPIDRRLQEISDAGGDEPHIQHMEGAFDVSWAEPVAKLIQPVDDWKMSRLKTKLVHAGYRSKSAVTLFLLAKLALAVLVPLIVIFPLSLNANFQGGAQHIVILSVLCSALGFFFPDVILRQKIKQRQVELLEAFPDALDLLVVCVEAGLALDGAIVRVAKELSFSWPNLADELQLVSLELRAGKARKEALKALAERTGLEEIQGLVSILIQAEHFGTSIAKSLREHSDEMRLSRIQRARETAAKLPVRMTIPVMLFIFPALFLVILGPAAIQIYITLVAPTQ